MAHVSLGGFTDKVYAARAIAGNGVYMPDASTVLNKSGESDASDDWGEAQLSGIAASDGFLLPAGQEAKIQFIGNSGDGLIQEYDPVEDDWVTQQTISDAEAVVLEGPMGPFRIGMATHAGTTTMTLRTQAVAR